MNVLHVVHYPVFGGPHNNILRTARPLAEQGWRTTALLPAEPGNAADRLRSAGVDVVQLPLHRLRARLDPRLHVGLAVGLLPEVARIRHLIRDRDIDLVKVSGLNPHAGIAARLEDKPVVWQIVDSRPPPAVRHASTAVAVRLADVLLFNGRALADLHGGPSRFRQPWFTYFPPVDTATFTPDAARGLRTRQALGIPAEARVVGTVSNLNPQKGLEYLIRATGRLNARAGGVWLLIVGASYPQHHVRTTLEAELRRSGIPPQRVLFTGAVADPETYYPAMDVKLVTSVPRSEGTTTTALEALACGVPVVATDVGAVRETIDPGRTGFVVPPRDSEAIADAALRLLQDEGRRRNMGELAAREARRRFGVASYVDVLLDAFRTAHQHRARRLPSGTAGQVHRSSSAERES